MVDYARFDRLSAQIDAEEAEEKREAAARGVHSPPPDVRDDLEDYFLRLDAASNHDERSADQAASVHRFAPEQLRTLPTVEYDAAGVKVAGAYAECAICLLDFEPGETLAKLPCAAGHVFHVACARSALTRSVYCPLCRVDLRTLLCTEEGEIPPATEAHQLGFTRDGGRIMFWDPSPDPAIPRPEYIPAHLSDQAQVVEIWYEDLGLARIWRVPRHVGDGAE